jgi:FkbM family methyltransferase
MSLYVEKALALCGILKARRGRRAFARWRPFSIASYQLVEALRREGFQFHTVIDAGANVGQFARAAAETFPDATVISIEALPASAETLRANLAGHPRVEVIQTAVGSSDGRIQFFPNEYSLASSALPLKTDKVPSFGQIRHLGAIDVPLARLDTLFRDREFRGPTLLKLDLQGFELEALKGAQETLAQCDKVLVETTFDPDYEGAPSFDELLTFLHDHGFAFLSALSFFKDSDGRVVEMDALFAAQSDRGQHRDGYAEQLQASLHDHEPSSHHAGAVGLGNEGP